MNMYWEGPHDCSVAISHIWRSDIAGKVPVNLHTNFLSHHMHLASRRIIFHKNREIFIFMMKKKQQG